MTSKDPRADNLAESKSNPLSVHFDISAALCSERREYATKLTNDLTIRGLDALNGTLEERQKTLKSSLTEEWTYLATSATLKHHGTGGKKLCFF